MSTSTRQSKPKRTVHQLLKQAELELEELELEE